VLFGTDVNCGEYRKMITHSRDYFNPRNEVWVCAKNQVQHNIRKEVDVKCGIQPTTRKFNTEEDPSTVIACY